MIRVKRLLEEHAAGPPPGDSNSQQFHPASEIDLLRQRQDFWWISSEVKVACREIIVARERQSDVAESGGLMNTLLMRLCKLQGWRSYRGIRAVSKNNHSVLRAKEWWQESHALQNITIPVIHRLPEEQLQKKQRRQSPPHQLIHYHLSQVVVEHATQISKRLKQLDSTAAELSLKGDDTSPTDAACLQEISKCSKQTRLAFLEMCRKDAHNVPFSAFEHITGMQTAVTSQNLRHLSLIDLGGVSYRQLPLSNATLCALIRRHAEGRSHGYETQYDFIQEAKRRLREYANCSDDVYASLRFLGLALIKEMEDVNTKTSLWIDTFIELMDANKLGSCWQGWHPNRLAAAATYLHLFVAKPQETMSRRHARIRAKAIYMPACDIHSLQALASHSLPLHVCESGAASPRVEDGAASPRAEDGSNDALAPRVAVVQTLEASQQAIASPPVVCELCHKGFIGRDTLAAHCNQAHGNWAEYRKRLFFMAWQAGLRPLLPWVKRSMLHSHAFFRDTQSHVVSMIGVDGCLLRNRADSKLAQSVPSATGWNAEWKCTSLQQRTGQLPRPMSFMGRTRLAECISMRRTRQTHPSSVCLQSEANFVQGQQRKWTRSCQSTTTSKIGQKYLLRNCMLPALSIQSIGTCDGFCTRVGYPRRKPALKMAWGVHYRDVLGAEFKIRRCGLVGIVLPACAGTTRSCQI